MGRRMSTNQRLALGLGCDRDTPLATVKTTIDQALALCNADINDVHEVASINLKADEPALQQLAQQQGWTIHFYTAHELAKVDVPNPSETVRKHTGTPSVSEAAALLARLAASGNFSFSPSGKAITAEITVEDIRAKLG